MQTATIRLYAQPVAVALRANLGSKSFARIVAEISLAAKN
jgi:hypothetical protein